MFQVLHLELLTIKLPSILFMDFRWLKRISPSEQSLYLSLLYRNIYFIFHFTLRKNCKWSFIITTYPAPLSGKPSSVNKFSQPSLLNKSFVDTSVSASTKFPATTAISPPCVECNLLATATRASSHPHGCKFPSSPRTYGVFRRCRFKPSYANLEWIIKKCKESNFKSIRRASNTSAVVWKYS